MAKKQGFEAARSYHAGGKKMFEGPVMPHRGLAHHEAHARSMHKDVDGAVRHSGKGHAYRAHQRAIVSAGTHGSEKHSSGGKRGLMNSAKMKNPAMGADKGYGGY
jgi:hypothetical protein